MEWHRLVVPAVLCTIVMSGAISGHVDAQTVPVDTGSTPPTLDTAAPQTVATDETDGVASNDGQGGAKNIVQIRNRIDGRLRIKANVQLHRDNGGNASPVNLALATGSCTDC